MNESIANHRRRVWWIVIAASLQVLTLAGVAISYYAIGWFGQEIRVRTVPVDPRDLLYGEYVNLHYDLNALDASMWKGNGRLPERGETVYVLVRPGSDGIVQAQAVYRDKPAAGPDEVVLKGRVQYGGDAMIDVKYGIEKYFVAEGTGKTLEEHADRLVVRMKVASWGQAKIEKIENVE